MANLQLKHVETMVRDGVKTRDKSPSHSPSHPDISDISVVMFDSNLRSGEQRGQTTMDLYKTFTANERIELSLGPVLLRLQVVTGKCAAT